jgi:uncharacterized protein
MTLRKLLLFALLLAASACMFAIDCKHATARIDLAVCQSPNLTHLDSQLNDLYSALRPQIAGSAKPALLAQQRTWLARRNTACATANPACLTAQYNARIDDLTALTASANALDGPMEGDLKDVTPIIVRGRWKAIAIDDPAASSAPAPADLQSSLAAAKLPALGAFMDTGPGKVCVAPQPCATIGWFRSKLAASDNGPIIADELKLPQSTPVLSGSAGVRHGGYTLIPRSDKTLLAVFALCQPNSTNCRRAAEVLTAASPDASVSTHP